MRINAGGGPHQKRRLRQQTASTLLRVLRLGRHRHPPKRPALHIGKLIVIRQHIIQHHKIGLHIIARTQVAPQNLREEFHRLLANGRPQPLLLRRVAKGLVHRRINLHPVHRIDIQPLRHKRLHKLLRLGIRHHAIHLRGEHLRLEQFAGVRQPSQRRVGHAAPEKIGQPRRQFMRVEWAHLVTGRFH